MARRYARMVCRRAVAWMPRLLTVRPSVYDVMPVALATVGALVGSGLWHGIIFCECVDPRPYVWTRARFRRLEVGGEWGCTPNGSVRK